MKRPLLRIVLAVFGVIAAFSCQKSNSSPNPPAPSVNAGPSQTIVYPQDTTLLNGTAHDAASRIVGYIWSEISGPNTATIVDDGNPTTIVRGLTLGTYVFQLMAVDSIGKTGVDTISVSVVKRVDTLTTYWPGASLPYELNFLSNSTYAVNGSNQTSELTVEAWTINSAFVTGRSLLNFNTSGLPSGVTSVKSAHLYLFSDLNPDNGDLVHANYGSQDDFYIQRISSAWNTTGGTSWNNLPTVDTTSQVYVPTTASSFLDVNIDVTNLFNTMLTKGNYGFEMRLVNEVTYNSRIFCSSSYSDSTRRPYLVVNY